MSFLSPWLLLGLLLLPAVVGMWLLAERRRMRYAVRYSNVDVLATLVSARSWLRLVAPAVFLLGLGVLLFALARPQVNRTVVKDKATVILVVDTSRSMQAEDVEPTRLGAAQEAVRTFLDQAPGDLRVGLVVFAGETQVATPPTTKHELVGQAVDEMDDFLLYGGTAIGDALQTAVELGRRITGQPSVDGEIASRDLRGPTRLLAQAGSDGAESPVSILFLSDGAQTRGLLEPLEGAALAKEAGIPVYTIALGTPDGVIDRGSFGWFGGSGQGGGSDRLIPVPPDPVTLNAIAEVTGGEFSEARTAESLERAYANLGSRLGREPGKTEVTFLFVAVAAGLLLLAGVFSAVLAPRLP
ncbi:MAG TPA: VWA domain-containing protein [Gaiellaceae bacterium]|nr:VWA domain-containing protein [Gaiellaceae bacterium]